VAVYRPGFVPDRFGPPTLLEARTDGEPGPRYTVDHAAPDEHLVLILGLGHGAYANTAPPDTREPITVRGVGGELTTSAIGSPAFGVAWREANRSYQLQVHSRRMTRDEVLRVASSLAPAS
jgi:hypothetical protein